MNLLIRLILPVSALGLIIFTAYHVMVTAPRPDEQTTPPLAPPQTEFTNTVAGSGIIEARYENIAIGTPVSGLVMEVFVKVDDRVNPGDLLFKIDDRELQAELEVRKASLIAAQTELTRLQNMPRKEQLPVNLAAIEEAEANLADLLDDLQRTEQLARGPARAMTEQDVIKRRQAYNIGIAKVKKAKAELDLLKAGTWQYDLDVAQMEIKRTEALIQQTNLLIKRTEVRALVPGKVLQVNIRPGEFAAAQAGQSLILLGDIDTLHVRVDIDEHDIPRFRPDTPAYAMLKGESKEKFPLTFVREEPYVIPKKSLTGLNTERVDTRVLQVIYAMQPATQKLRVGQQVDVFIDAQTADK
ncbi:MAG: biotin/lipoyl-binding protein [Pirellulales bacterium]|nr:biotin/lipoyl-binding protein [Pirellulales bacterium]